MPIALLTPETVGKIAAGEVVERAASVVKELLENAIDAGATRIAIAIEEGGARLIEVSDDGCGMTGDELQLAVQRHATSKLRSFDDLHRLRTLGFRGEALPSIAAVSDFRVVSRPASERAGFQIEIAFGELRPIRTVGAPMGTSVTVRDLFGNVPARRKFLRQTATESGYVQRIVAAYAVAYPRIAVTLTVDGRRVFATDGTGDHLTAAAAVYGPEVGQSALVLEPLDESAAVPGVNVRGWVGPPTVTRSHRQQMVFFVNGRWIQSRSLSFALDEAYHSLVMVGRHPIATVLIEVDPEAVDVNVHPTKAEVKFVDERAVCRAVQRAAHAALATGPLDALPEVQFGEVSVAAAHQPGLGISPGFAPAPLATPDQNGDGAPSPAAHPSGVPILRVLGQVGGTYIIAEGPDGMYLIDQHAAHERVMYEKILGQLARKLVDRQPLLDPLVVDLAPDELAAFELSRDELHEIGFEIEPFGEGAVVVRAVPALIQHVNIAERLHLILGELAEGGAGSSWLDSVAISAACHTSIRAGQALSLPEMRELVAELERSSQPRACGHGRPTMIHVTQGELERQFSRR